MTVKDLSEKIGAEIVTAKNNSQTEVTGGYICDLLSLVISKATDGSAWITVIGNINTIAVASLTDVSCIILSESTPLDKDAEEKANMIGIPVLKSDKSSFELAVEIGKLLNL